MNISETSGPIATKFYLKHHWVGGKDALGFGLDRIRTLVSMATDSSHRVIMGENVVNTLAPSFLIGSSSYLQVTRTNIISRTGQVRSGDQDHSCSMLLYHVISTTCSHAGGWGSTALAGHSSRSMLVFTQN